MPSQHIGTFLSQKEVQMVEETIKKTGMTKYRLFKDALHEYCESRLKEGTELDRGKTERRGPERDSESGGDTKTDNQGGNQAGPTPTAEHGSDLEEYLRYLRVAG